ncbi:MAG: peptidylprolyl isomerase, partial [bacterium]
PNIVADIDGNYITALEYKAAMNRRLVRIMNKFGVIRGSDRHEVKLSVFRALLNDKMLESAGEREGVVATPEDVNEKFVALRERFYESVGHENPEYFKFFMMTLGFRSEDEFRKYLEYEVLELKLSQKLFPDSEIEVSDEDVLESIPTRRMRQIFFQLDTSAAPSDVDINNARVQIRKRAENVYKRAVAGESFAKLAEKYSDEAYAADGGNIGWVSERAVIPKFWAVASRLQPNQISPPFETDFGIHILKLEVIADPTSTIYQAQRHLMKSYVRIKKRQAKFASWFFRLKRRLEEENRIKIYDPFLLAVKYENMGEFDSALDYYRKASKNEPNDSYILINVGKLVARQAKYTEALQEFQRATEMNPMDPSLYFTLGEVYMSLGEHQKALLEFSKASDMAKLDYELHRRLESIYTQLGLFQDADRERQRYLLALELRRSKGQAKDLPFDVPRATEDLIKPEAFPELKDLLKEGEEPPGGLSGQQ